MNNSHIGEAYLTKKKNKSRIIRANILPYSFHRLNTYVNKTAIFIPNTKTTFLFTLFSLELKLFHLSK